MKKRLMKSTILLLLCLILMGTGTYAWLSRNRLVKAKNIDTELAFNGAVIINVDIYKYDQETNTIIEISDDPKPAMTSYDSIFTERNVHTPLVLKITLLGEFKKCEHMDLILTCTSSAAKREPFVTSNLVYMKAASKETIGIDGDAPIAKQFQDAVDYFKGVTQSDQFLTVTKKEDGSWEFTKKKTMITYPLILTDDEKGHEKKTVDIYMILDYSEELILAHELDKYGEIEIMESEVKFDTDFDKLQFNVINKETE